MTCLTGQANAVVALGNFRTAPGGNADRLKESRPQRYGIVVLDGDESCSESRT